MQAIGSSNRVELFKSPPPPNAHAHELRAQAYQLRNRLGIHRSHQTHKRVIPTAFRSAMRL